MENTAFSVNALAPRDGKLCVYFKKVGEKLSDGFAAVFDGEIYLIDVGRKYDDEMVRFLLELREKWLEAAPADLDRESARLDVHMIISHPHPDHVGAIPLFLSEPRLSVVELIAPERSYRSLPGPDFIPKLEEFEKRLYDHVPLLAEYHHKTTTVKNLPYGKIYSIRPEKSDVTLDIYPSPMDWSRDPEGFRYLMETSVKNNPYYRLHPEEGCANGAMNGNSLWVKIKKGNQTVLITGDQRADDAMLGSMIRFYGEEEFHCDVLKLTHHGENNYPPYLIEIASPSITVFTTSREEATQKTVELCEEVSTAYYLKRGNLIITLDGKAITAKQYE